jgi:hypothetical protein
MIPVGTMRATTAGEAKICAVHLVESIAESDSIIVQSEGTFDKSELFE